MFVRQDKHCAIATWRAATRSMVSALALCSLFLLIVWHDSAVSIHLAPPAVQGAELADDESLDHAHVTDTDRPDVSKLAHQAAHAAHQATTPLSPALRATLPLGDGSTWTPFYAFSLRSFAPTSLLRPPRA